LSNNKFVNLHGHSNFSLLDGMTRVNELVDYTLEIGQPASCITDHGVMYSIVDHFKYAKSKGQKAIAGFEAYVTKDHKIKDKTEAQSETENKREHMVLLAKNNDGYKKIAKMCSIGTTEGFYYRPRIDDKVMQDIGTDNVIALSACLAGRIAQRIIKDDIEGAEKWAIYYYQLFKENFYLEIQPTKEPSQIKVNLGLIEIHKKTGIPIVATSDFHYLRKEDNKTHDALLAIQSRSLLDDPNRWKFPGDTFYVMTREEVLSLFNQNGHEVLDQKIVELAVDTTVQVAEQCNVNFDFGKAYLPVVDTPHDNEEFNSWAEKRKEKLLREDKPEETNSALYMRYLCIKGLKAKGLTSQEYKDRLEFEIEVINKMGFPDYFLIMEDIMRFCRENDIPYGPARGCFLPDMQVQLADGILKNIQDVQIGDIVVGHDETPHKVIDTLQYDCEEEIAVLECGDKIIKCTKDHKIYAVKKEDWDKGICEPKWYKADELNEEDYIAELD